ncbi:MAG: bifunctional glutamate N-acetyltransferase/amino-acid acetyltransferase ArgJ [Endomicrobium sp.]|jgi:glutamate N-acetyltransferase/amino-acid N-acetyltransferase|nr:bifunctional glutamate N-acetyltransferase/amino-acid acetyltransferase ArgJ [Endomicrobium sp.]
MFPKGFKAGGIRCGLHKKEGKKDLALFISEVPASAAGMFTKSVTKAAPVLIDIEKMKKGGKISAIIANSGCANACTGKKGKTDALSVCSETEKEFDLQKNSVLCASTGVIGQYLNMNAFKSGIKKLKNALGSSKKNEEESVLAIMTTDTFIKKAFKKIKTAKGEITIWGCVKGAGMIHPNMQGLHATMLSFIMTDAEIDSKTLQKLLESSAQQSYNCVSVDGDTSTNDTLIILANGQSKTGKLSSADLKKFAKALDEVTLSLAKQIAKDGEGATKFIEIEVRGAKTKSDAKAIASTVASSPLFKTAVFGADANWGRVIAAAGRAGVEFDPEKTDIYMGGFLTSRNGMAVTFPESKAKKALQKKEIKVVIDLKSGKESSKYYTCDFSYDYVKINGDYRS